MLNSPRCQTVGSRYRHALYFTSHPPYFFTTATTTVATHKGKSSLHQALHSFLEKCSAMRELKLLHAQIILRGMTQEILTLGKIISFCAVSDVGNLHYAQLVFDQIPEPNRYMYNSLIRGYLNCSDPVKAILLHHRMTRSGILPNEFTVPFVLKACASKSAYLEGVLVHVQVTKLGFGSHVCAQNALISFYVGCGLIECARNLFDEISDRTLVSWNSMISGYSKMGCGRNAFLLFREMRKLGVECDGFTFVSLLSVCAQNCDAVLGRYIHLYTLISGVKADIYVHNALVDMYAKCGHLHSAQTVFEHMVDKNVVSWTSMVSAYAKQGLLDFARTTFDQISVKNVISWNSMISGYVQEGHCKDALDLFSKMFNSGVVPDEATLVSVLSACSQLGNLLMGKMTHDYICCNSISPCVTLCNALVDMYANCGSIQTALDIFHEMPEKNVVSWNIMIGKLALHGCGLKAIELFKKMQASGICPDGITFTGLLSACSHSGLVDCGRYYFETMNLTYRLPYEIQHYACMIDLLGRGGLLEQAVKLIVEMPVKPDIVVWSALLGACRTHGSIKIGKQILKQLLELEPCNAGLYVLMSNIYCEARRWEDVKKIRTLMSNHLIKKEDAISSIEICGYIYEFMVDDKRHEVSISIYDMLDRLTDHLKFEGYSCNYWSAFLNAEEI